MYYFTVLSARNLGVAQLGGPDSVSQEAGVKNPTVI